jgi:hypothetical protein
VTTCQFDVSIEAYHRDERLSASKLKTFAQLGAHGFYAKHIARNAPPEPDQDALVFGQVFEDLAQGRGFNAGGNLVLKPEGMEFRSKENKKWRDDHLAAGRSIVTQADIDTAMAMRSALEENVTAVEMVRACLQQATLRTDYKGTPGLQSRPDYLSIDGCATSGFAPFSVDLKSCKSLSDLTSGRGVLSYRYDAQGAIVRQCWGVPGSRHYLLACEKAFPFRCQVIPLSDAWLDVGWRWTCRQMGRLARHYESGLWPRTDGDIAELPSPPQRATDDYEESALEAAE